MEKNTLIATSLSKMEVQRIEGGRLLDESTTLHYPFT